mmetsp:Transcript_11588/g.16650  ORF Transcript_11588/g.16650 Transcript_11588/m.16650 type:complete len:471 (+) Transcript_11588:84-1496(+)
MLLKQLSHYVLFASSFCLQELVQEVKSSFLTGRNLVSFHSPLLTHINSNTEELSANTEESQKPYDLIIDTKLKWKKTEAETTTSCYVDGQQLSDFLMEVFGAQTVTSTKRTSLQNNEDIFGEPIVDYSKADDCFRTTTTGLLTTELQLLSRGTHVWKDAVIVARIVAQPMTPKYLISSLEELLEISPEYALCFRIEPIVEKDEVAVDWCAQVQKTWPPCVLRTQPLPIVVAFPFHTDQDCSHALRSADYEKTDDTDIIQDYDKIVLEGGSGFGTGEHPTTFMCSEWLATQVVVSSLSSQQRTHSEKSSFETHILDYGTGSGILAFVALVTAKRQKDFVRVDAVDVDLDALESAKRNKVLNNNKERQVEFYTPMKGTPGWEVSSSISLPQDRKNTYHIVVANILAQPLMELSKTLSSFTKTNSGIIGLSGILAHQAEAVIDAYKPYFDVKVIQQNGSWVFLEGHRNNQEVS